jgi:hypothetical protein
MILRPRHRRRHRFRRRRKSIPQIGRITRSSAPLEQQRCRHDGTRLLRCFALGATFSDPGEAAARIAGALHRIATALEER